LERGGVTYTNFRGKKNVLERHSGLCPEKELPEQHSSAFCHKITPGYRILLASCALFIKQFNLKGGVHLG
jgi:hypothetical protein